MQEREEFRPARGDVRKHQRVEECSFGAVAAVRHQVSFQETRSFVVPIRERPHGDLMLQQSARLRGGDPPTSVLLAQRLKDAIDRGGTDREELVPGFRRQSEMSMPLQNWDEFREERHQPLPADAVHRRPGHDQGLLHLRTIGPRPRPANRLRRTEALRQQLDRILPGVPRGSHELVQDRALLALVRFAIAGRYSGE